MIRHRGGAPSQEQESSSDEEEDVFSTLSLQATKQQASAAKQNEASTPVPNNPETGTISTCTTATAASLPVSNTSSMKRHHLSSDSRKAKMEAVLQQLEVDTHQASTSITAKKRAFEKTGSFVQPGEEHLTTNIFVGNLAPSITEEQMTDLFRQFGDLYSLKIMWPRTLEERARNRHTGFVCFMNRQDAQDAMEACDETDAFHVGRRIMMRWGKNVKKIASATSTPFATKQTNTTTSLTLPNPKRPRLDHNPDTTQLLGSDAIQVVIPKDPKRARFITTVASFVAKDGSLLEQRFIAQESQNPTFSFLTWSESMNAQQWEEHVFYKWRVYAFCQGDGLQTWRMDPFFMFSQNGQCWIPPPINRAAALQEEQATIKREQRIRQEQAQRRRGRGRNDHVTGRQLEQARSYSGGAADGSAQMTAHELTDFHVLTRDKLCASRMAICHAMAYCFEKSGAAKQIANLLQELLVDNGPGVSVDTRIARLYLLSDVLYNSQQPGVRNAFLYRDAIERMAPNVFSSLGKHGNNGKIGRMTFLKLKTAVSSILSAWTNWSVYNPAFIDELEARFHGREVAPPAKLATKDDKQSSLSPPPTYADTADNAPVLAETATVLKPRGDWKEVADDDDRFLTPVQQNGKVTLSEEPAEAIDSDVDGEPLEDDDLDGESLGDDDLVIDGTTATYSGETDQTRQVQAAMNDESDEQELDGDPLDDTDC